MTLHLTHNRPPALPRKPPSRNETKPQHLPSSRMEPLEERWVSRDSFESCATSPLRPDPYATDLPTKANHLPARAEGLVTRKRNDLLCRGRRWSRSQEHHLQQKPIQLPPSSTPHIIGRSRAVPGRSHTVVTPPVARTEETKKRASLKRRSTINGKRSPLFPIPSNKSMPPPPNIPLAFSHT